MRHALARTRHFAPRWRFALVAVFAAAMLACSVAPAWAADPFTQIYSLGNGNVMGDLAATKGVISADGRYVAFLSNATNLVASDTNGRIDLFLRDRLGWTTERISVSSTGAQANGDVTGMAISTDGRYVVYTSWATNLVPNDTNNAVDVFVYDRLAKTTERVNVGPGGVEANDGGSGVAISGDGNRIAFASWATNLVDDDANGATDVFVRDRAAGTTTLVSRYTGSATIEGNAASDEPAISADGRFVVFTSGATNLIAAGTDTNGVDDIYLRDLNSTATQRVSVSDTEAQATNSSMYATVSASGRFIAFRSNANNLVAGDTNGDADIFVRDMSGTTIRASVSDTEAQANGASTRPAISWGGTVVAFESDASNLIDTDTNGATDVFVRNTGAGTTLRASVYGPSIGGSQSISNQPSQYASITSEGGCVCFTTNAWDLVGGDTNGEPDVFVRTTRLRDTYINEDEGGITFDRWVTGFSSAYTGGSYVYSRWTNCTLEFKFRGESITWYGPKQPNYGIAEVYVDGVSKGFVDCYAPGGSATLYTQLYSSGPLEYGDHTLKIRLTGTKNAASTGYVVVADQFWVGTWSHGVSRARHDELDGGVLTGTWISPVNPTYLAGRYSYSRWPTANYRRTFVGRYVTWIGPRTNAYGTAKIYIDGVYRATVDQYGTQGWRYAVWESPELAFGVHTIDIKPTGLKRAASSGTSIVIDAIEARP